MRFRTFLAGLTLTTRLWTAPARAETPPGSGGPPSVTLSEPASATAAPDAKPDLKKIEMGFGLRVGSRMQNANDPSKMDDFGLDEIYVEPRFSGQLTPIFAWQAAFNAQIPTNSSPGLAAGVSVMDLIAKFEPHEAFHLWVGRMLVPADRSNLSGPWFMSPWKYPGADYPAAFVGPHTGPYGRDNGVTTWGQFGGGKAKYYLGAFNLNDATVSPLFSGRVNICLLGAEPGFYHSSTYYGGQSIIALAGGFQYQKNAAFDDPTQAFTELNADLLAEKNLAGAGVLTVEAGYYHFGHYFAALAMTPVVKDAYYLLASWLTPEKLGIGKLQPLARWQQAKDTNISWKILDAYLTYVIDDYSLRVAAGFEHTDFGAGTTGNSILLGVQMQR